MKNNSAGLRRLLNNIGGTRNAQLALLKAMPVVSERASRIGNFFRKPTNANTRTKQSREISDPKELI